MIAFNAPFHVGTELGYIREAIDRGMLSGDGYFTKRCESLLQNLTGAAKVLLTSSCTHALEMCALLCDIQEGDEVIMSSFNFVSVANAFVLRGAKIVFVDIRPDTMNINEELIEEAISPRTKVILAMHYGGVACEMEKIMALANPQGIIVVEDAAHCIDAYYKGQHLGAIGHLGTISFHATKNIQCGEGGCLLVNDDKFIDRALVIREKGTNRFQYDKGLVDKYSWVDIGSSYLMSELNAAYLWGQLEVLSSITRTRLGLWSHYRTELSNFLTYEVLQNPKSYKHNAHLFFIKLKDEQQRDRMILALKEAGLQSSFHYVPLHSSSAGTRYGKMSGEDHFTSKESLRLLRLPLHMDLSEEIITSIIEQIEQAFIHV